MWQIHVTPKAGHDNAIGITFALNGDLTKGQAINWVVTAMRQLGYKHGVNFELEIQLSPEIMEDHH